MDVLLGRTFLLLEALFHSFLFPLVIMVAVPLATLGGGLGLRLRTPALSRMPWRTW